MAAEPGFAAVPRHVLRGKGNLSGYGKLIYALLIAHTNGEGACWPSYELLAEESGWNRKTVMKAVAELVAAGLVTAERGRFNNTYRLTESVSGTPSTKEGERRSPSGGPTESTTGTDGVLLEDWKYSHRSKAIEVKPKDTRVLEVAAYYRQHIHAEARLTDKARAKITTRLKEFSVADLCQAIDHFAADHWQMHESSNRTRGMPWWFDSEDRVARYLHMTPRPTANGHVKASASVLGSTQPGHDDPRWNDLPDWVLRDPVGDPDARA